MILLSKTRLREEGCVLDQTAGTRGPETLRPSLKTAGDVYGAWRRDTSGNRVRPRPRDSWQACSPPGARGRRSHPRCRAAAMATRVSRGSGRETPTANCMELPAVGTGLWSRQPRPPESEPVRARLAVLHLRNVSRARGVSAENPPAPEGKPTECGSSPRRRGGGARTAHALCAGSVSSARRSPAPTPTRGRTPRTE
jgi:hypothetical protein